MALISDWRSRCLICMNDVPAKIPVFGSHGRKKSVRRMIAEFLNVTVRESDCYPKQICERCYGTLHKINELKGCAHESLRNLKLLQNLHQQEQEDRKAEDIRLWLGSQRTEPGEISVDSSDQQLQSDYTFSSLSANETTSSIGMNISENSDVFKKSRSVSSKAAGTPISLSAPASRSASPQAVALKQYRSLACSPQAVQQNGVDWLPEKNIANCGSPQSTGRSSTRKQSKNLAVNSDSATRRSKSNNILSQASALLTEREEFHRSRSCSPFAESSSGVPVGKKRRRGRPRSRSLPPSKRRKPEAAEPQQKSPRKPYLDDDIYFGRIISSCDLKQFKKHIPFVKLERLATDLHNPDFKFPGYPWHVSRQQDFKLVQETQDGISQQFCWICNKTFPSNENMHKHLMKHKSKAEIRPSPSQAKTKPKPSLYGCNLCPRNFSSSFSLRQHMRCHVAKKWSYKCMVCEEVFPTTVMLEDHVAKHNIRCPACDAVFKTVQDLESHRKCHEQGFTCSCCLQKFSSEEALRKHVVQHRKCTLCNKTFTGKNELATHVAECHKVCNICDETVADEEELQSHIETSHEKCNLCGEQFLGEEELSTHLTKHPYQCVLCLSAFNDKAHRNEHINLAHQEMLELLKENMSQNNTTL